MQPKYITIGTGDPHIIVVGCLHGDEPLGRDVVEQLKTIELQKGTLTLVVAHEAALARNVRFIETDMNRAFPGRPDGALEERLAYELTPLLRSADCVVDIHTTRSAIDALLIITERTKNGDGVLAAIDVPKVAYIDRAHFGKGGMINEAQIGVSLEYGTAEADPLSRAYTDVVSVLSHFGMTVGASDVHKEKELYTIVKAYSVPDGFVHNEAIRDFVPIRKGDQVGTVDGVPIIASESFYPLFVGNGRYTGTLALCADRTDITLEV